MSSCWGLPRMSRWCLRVRLSSCMCQRGLAPMLLTCVLAARVCFAVASQKIATRGKLLDHYHHALISGKGVVKPGGFMTPGLAVRLVHPFCAPDAEQHCFGMLDFCLVPLQPCNTLHPCALQMVTGPCRLWCGWLQGCTLPLDAVSGHQQCSCRALSQSWPLCCANLGQP